MAKEYLVFEKTPKVFVVFAGPPIPLTNTSPSTPSVIQEQAEREQASLVVRTPGQDRLRIPFLLGQENKERDAVIALWLLRTGKMFPRRRSEFKGCDAHG